MNKINQIMHNAKRKTLCLFNSVINIFIYFPFKL